METFSTHFLNFFSCFECASTRIGKDYVASKHIAVAFSFLCSGNKSSKLALGFELFDDHQSGYLDPQKLIEYLRSYLIMLVGFSLLSSSPNLDTKKLLGSPHQDDVFEAVENGAKWTFGHFEREFKSGESVNGKISFEDFAQWYTGGGYNTAPWLELLDLTKFLSLIDAEPLPNRSPKVAKSETNDATYIGGSTPSLMGSFEQIQPVEVLFRFPLANHRSLVVLREDATYVRTVVEELGVLSMPPEELWNSLFSLVRSRPSLPSLPWSQARFRKAGVGKGIDVDQPTFVSCMEEVIRTSSPGKKRPAPGSHKSLSSVKDTLNNFFQSFDMSQVQRVAINQLMGGLTLLCGGKKSTKLSFAFGLFDGQFDSRKAKKKGSSSIQCLTSEELFLFLRSFLIVMFSCCRQSLDLSAADVGRYISDTAQMVSQDVMKYQWHKRQRDKVDFDDFGKWYNDGGYKTAPWLELLDLKKWVLLEDDQTTTKSRPKSSSYAAPPELPEQAPDFPCPPALPDDTVDANDGFLGDIPIDDIEMDYMLLQQDSQDKENDDHFTSNKILSAYASPKPSTTSQTDYRNKPSTPSSLKFHLATSDDHGGYSLSISQIRVRHLKRLLVESNLCKINIESAARTIMDYAAVRGSGGRPDRSSPRLTKEGFDSAMRSVIAKRPGTNNMSEETQRELSDLLTAIFSAYDFLHTGEVNAAELACGFTGLCDGKKSDKLEYAFELLDEDKDGHMTRHDMTRYLRSFLTVLLTISATPWLDRDENEDMISTLSGRRRDESIVAEAAEGGAQWATSQAFKGDGGKTDHERITFDDFADWYTTIGYGSIPWLELLDLRKWVLIDT